MPLKKFSLFARQNPFSNNTIFLKFQGTYSLFLFTLRSKVFFTPDIIRIDNSKLLFIIL